MEFRDILCIFRSLMKFFDGIYFEICDHLPDCIFHMDTVFHYYAINLIKSGSFVFGTGENAPIAQENLPAVLITGPGKRLKYGPGTSGNWDHYFVTFRGTRTERWIESGLMPKVSDEGYWLKPVADSPQLAESFLQLIESIRNTPRTHARAVNQLEGLLLMIQELANEYDSPTQGGIIPKQIAAIRATPETPWDVAQLADEAEYSVAHYRRMFRELAQCSPAQLIRKCRMLKAAHLLRASREPIDLIAATCGYDDRFHFSKQFKREYGEAPGAYRKNR